MALFIALLHLNSKCKQDGSVPGISIGLVGILDFSSDIAQEVIIVVQVVTQSDTHAGALRRATRIGGLMKKLCPDLKLRQKLVGQNGAGLTGNDGPTVAAPPSPA